MSVNALKQQELLDQIAVAIAETPAYLEAEPLARVLIELEDVVARLSAGESLTKAYRQTLFFDVIAMRNLDESDTNLQYLNLLSEIASAIDRIDPPLDR
jgi:hypothetical protein